jgi:hypothetical protein
MATIVGGIFPEAAPADVGLRVDQRSFDVLALRLGVASAGVPGALIGSRSACDPGIGRCGGFASHRRPGDDFQQVTAIELGWLLGRGGILRRRQRLGFLIEIVLEGLMVALRNFGFPLQVGFYLLFDGSRGALLLFFQFDLRRHEFVFDGRLFTCIRHASPPCRRFGLRRILLSCVPPALARTGASTILRFVASEKDLFCLIGLHGEV